MALTLKIYSPSEDLSNFLETEVDEDDVFLNSLPFAEITPSYVVLKVEREEGSFELKVSASNFDQTAKNINEVLSLSPGALIENVEVYVNGELAEREEYSPAELLSNLIGLDNDINKLEIVHSGDDFFYGSELGNEDDNVNGYAGNDTFQGNGDENGDIFHGGPGVDTAIYRGPRSNYVVSSASNLWDPVNYTASLQGFTVKDTTGLDGLDQLVDVEVLKFADVNIDLQNFTPDNNQDESDSGMDDDPRKEEGEYDERDRDDNGDTSQDGGSSSPSPFPFPLPPSGGTTGKPSKTINGSDTDDKISGSSVAEVIQAGAGNDTIIGSQGSDFIDGGSGIDLVQYSSTSSNSVVFGKAATGNGVTIRSGSDTDTLTNVERVQFSDTWVALDLDGNAGAAARVIVTAFGKSSLSELAGIGISLIDGGYTSSNVTQLIVDLKLIPTDTNEEFVSHIFANIVGRPPNILELPLFTSFLESGGYTQASLLDLAANSPLASEIVALEAIGGVALAYQPSLF